VLALKSTHFFLFRLSPFIPTSGVEISLDDLLDTLEGFELGDRVSGLEDDISI
jgi:hypothetical protein